MNNQDAVVAICENHEVAEKAVKTLQHAGFNMKQLSIVGRDYHTEEHVVGYYNAGDRMKYWGKLGAFWGAVWGVLVGAAFFWVPGIGPLVVGGPLVSAILGALEGATVLGGASALGAGLYSLGIPKNSVLDYETALRADKFLLLAHGTAGEVAKAKEVLDTTDATRTYLHAGRPAAAAI